MLEDEFVDVLRKAKRGKGVDDDALATRTGLPVETLAAWAAGSAVPSDEQAHALAHELGLDAAKFADSAGVRWHPDTTLPGNVTQHIQHSTPWSNGYILISRSDRTCAIVDPAGDPEKLYAAIAESGCELRYILLTHKHADHVERTGEVLKDHPNAEIVVHAIDAHGIGKLSPQAKTIADGETIPFGGGEIRAIATPGHTDGSICFLANDVVFTGDTLFAGSVGGAFGDNTTYKDILTNIRAKLLTLDPATLVMPGHGPLSTIANELTHNPFFP